ncbi:RHS repeat-associated core domain-containing protein [Pseudomonas retamae]|uniref:RHS repeat-associated core domain-containing protein n=1 Tax=Pseudomonas retamae TaxID=702110 RepID=A0ABW7DH23_9PSED
MTANLHWRTPALAVSDARGLPVRQVAYLRAVAADTPVALVTRQHHDPTGRLIEQWDPRLEVPALTSVHHLNGTVLRSASVDSGWRLHLPGLAGEPLQRWDQRNTRWRSTFDEQLRVLTLAENDEVVDTFTYADALADAGRNQRGQLLKQEDRSGTLTVDSFSLAGQALNETRTFHDGAALGSQYVFSPLDAVLEQTDAGGHRQRSRYGLAGQPRQLHLLINGHTEWQTVLQDAQYNAANQIIEQLAGNQVRSRWTYDPADGRLHTQSSRKSGGDVLQDFEYFYDRVGNILRIEDHAFEPHYFANQLVDGHRDFSYDSLYRLIRATGYDDAPLSEIPGLPQPTNPNNRLNYTQTYRYDHGGNLTELRHVRADNNYTRKMHVDSRSNRAVRWAEGVEPDFDTLFDRHGNQQAVHAGKPLLWTVRDEVQQVSLIAREHQMCDIERYEYSQGMRVFKRHEYLAANAEHFHQVRYLPGLEIRTKDHGEELHVISVGSARCLHWVANKPQEIDADQLRYSLEDHLGSCVIELDQQARLISQEGYYPFGETAWMAARSALEVSYRFVRYSGKEMDISGLYYYGARYYAPWVQRWVSADPAGDVDGLNLYGFVGNNPLRYFDVQGQQRTPSELLTVTKDYETLLGAVERRLDKSIYQLGHLNRTRDIYRSSGKRAALTFLNVFASAITAGTVATVGTVIGTAVTLNPIAGIGIGMGAAAIAADVTGAQIDRLGEDNAYGYALMPDGADYDVGRLKKEVQPKSWASKIKEVFQKYDPRTTEGNKEASLVGVIGAADALTDGTNLEKYLAFFRLTIEVTEALNDSLGQHDLDLVEAGVQVVADFLESQKELSDLALEELEDLGRENIATAQGTRYRLTQIETAVLGKMNRTLELLPRAASHIQQKSAVKG